MIFIALLFIAVLMWMILALLFVILCTAARIVEALVSDENDEGHGGDGADGDPGAIYEDGKAYCTCAACMPRKFAN